MKRLKFLAAVLPALAILGTGCLKDKNIEENKYGINLDQGVRGVSFNQSTSQNVGINVTNTPTTYRVVLIQASAATPAEEDIHVVINEKPSLVTAFNSTVPPPATMLTPLPAGSYTIVTNATIKKGNYYDTIAITFNNAAALSLSTTYGLGLTITSADRGYGVISNKRDILLKINIKNQYDGEYTKIGYFYHPSSPRAINRQDIGKTAGPNSITITVGDLTGNLALLTIDPVTNVVTSIVDAAGPISGPLGKLSALPPPYTPFAGSNPSIYNNTYNPVTRTFYLRYGYVGGTGYRVIEEVVQRN